MSMLRTGSRFAAVAVVLLTLIGLAASPALAAEGERVLDPRLSLVGGCEAETLDPVEDPGCPTTPPASAHPPAGFFAKPNAVATDFYGDIFVASKGKKADGTEGRIDIFSPKGVFISELSDPAVTAPAAMAIDSKGVLYVWSGRAGQLFRFEPCGTYDPPSGKLEYCNAPIQVPLSGPSCSKDCVREGSFLFMVGLAIDRGDDHLFVNIGGLLVEYSSAEEGNEELRLAEFKGSGTGFAAGLAVDSSRHTLFAQEPEGRIGVYDLAEGLPPEELKKTRTIDAASFGVPGGSFGGMPSIAVDEGSGHIFVFDTENAHLWELDEEGHYLATIEFSFTGNGAEGLQIAVDNGLTSPNGKLSEEEGRGRYLYVPSPNKNIGHSFAFFVPHVNPPEVKTTTVTSVSGDEAGLRAQINPGNLQTSYTFQVEVEGSSDWTTVGSGTLAASNLDVAVSATAKSLTPGTSYRFRVLATNEEGSVEAEGSFTTYPDLPAEPSPCPNALMRTGFSALLPDCRAYELVTPPDTNARAPLGPENEGGGYVTRQVSPAGDKVPFRVEGGALPGFGDGVGGLKGDPYLATRTPTGWSTTHTGPSGGEAASLAPGIGSPDQEFSFWAAAGEGSAVVSQVTSYVRYPDGHSALTGQGSLGVDPEASGKLISEGGGHIIFNTGTSAKSSTAIQLEPEAAPNGTQAVYDRTPDGVTHVVSLKPGNVPFEAGENAIFQGASLDGNGIAFRAHDLATEGNVLYLRYADKQTFRIGEGVEFAGVAEGGARIFYVENGNLEAFDVATESVIEFADTKAAVVPATISADGSTAYFISKNVVSVAGTNPVGAKPKTGAENLYRSKEGQIAFVGILTERDVVGRPINPTDSVDGLGLWVAALGEPVSGRAVGQLGIVPARSTPDGGVFLFKSRAALTGYDPEGHAEIYRYDFAGNELQCLSCNPTGLPAQSDANLQSETREGSELFSAVSWPENLRDDGRRAFFESSEPLVAGDVDGHQDVYEWEAQGVGSCTQPGGCLFLISSPQSRRDEYLWAVSRSGDDVFFLSSDMLTGTDADETPSIYDARVGGGFAEPASAECEGEGCRPQLTPPPSLTTGDTAVHGSGENFKPHSCGKGKHKVKRGGKVRCVRTKHHKRHGKPQHHRTGTGQKGAQR
jgi:hypothetical protein